VAISDDDVRHVADLARLALDAGRVRQLVTELNGILEHMAVLSTVDTTGVRSTPAAASLTPLRQDGGDPVPMLSAREEFAPETRDGFFTVPRLATHDGSAAPDAP
jgi:aspartyl-tRNA(Asn)/glutamyl-tRNA(Gln) amidotransferase subunit C